MPRLVLNFVFALCAMLLLCSCWTETVNPLSDPQKPQSDSKLEGRWKNEFGSINFTTRKDGWMDAVYESKDSNDKPYTERYSLFITTIGDNNYVNMKGEKQKNYLILNYKIAGDELSTSLMCDEEVKKAMASGALKAQKTGSQYEADTVVTDSGDKLAALVKAGEQTKLFPEPQKFKRSTDK